MELDASDVLSVRIDRTRKIPATILLRALGYEDNNQIMMLYDNNECIRNTLERDSTSNRQEALIEIYKRLRPGEPPTVDSAKTLLNTLYFDHKRYDLAGVGRYKINKKLQLDIDKNTKTLTLDCLLYTSDAADEL